MAAPALITAAIWSGTCPLSVREKFQCDHREAEESLRSEGDHPLPERESRSPNSQVPDEHNRSDENSRGSGKPGSQGPSTQGGDAEG